MNEKDDGSVSFSAIHHSPGVPLLGPHSEDLDLEPQLVAPHSSSVFFPQGQREANGGRSWGGCAGEDAQGVT